MTSQQSHIHTCKTIIKSIICNQNMGCIQLSGADGAWVTTTLNLIPGSHPKIGPESIMSGKSHGTSSTPVQENLRHGCDFKTADWICNFNRDFAEHAGYFLGGVPGNDNFSKPSTSPSDERNQPSFTILTLGKPLFTAPVNRSLEEWLQESRAHGWPSFRDAKVNWDTVRTLRVTARPSVSTGHILHTICLIPKEIDTASIW